MPDKILSLPDVAVRANEALTQHAEFAVQLDAAVTAGDKVSERVLKCELGTIWGVIENLQARLCVLEQKP